MTREIRRGPGGTEVVIDHEAKTVTGRVALPSPGPCPHSHTVYVQGVRQSAPCTGQAGHLSKAHADAEGRTWN